MSWLRAILLALQGVNGLVSWLRERQLLEAGEAKAIAEGLEISNARIRKAMEARRRANNDNDPDPDDPYIRD